MTTERFTENQILQDYMQALGGYEPLKPEEEAALARRWQNEGDRAAAHTLTTSHLRLVVKVAMGFRGYGLSINEMIQEGNLGLMHAINRFDPERGFRLSTYAIWWIRAQIQEYILRNWSVVRVGTSTGQKKLFFNLRRLKRQIKGEGDDHLDDAGIAEIAEELGVSQADVIRMDQRMTGSDHSLDAIVSGADGGAGEEGNAPTWMEWLVDDRPNQEMSFGSKERKEHQYAALREVLESMPAREKEIFIARRLKDPQMTLEQLAEIYGVSRERIRQLEARAYQKVEAHMHREFLAA